MVNNNIKVLFDRRIICLAAIALLFIHTNIAQNPISGNQGFSVLTEGNFTSTGGHTIRGPIAVGGNLVLNNSTGSVGEVNKDNVGTYIFPGDGTNTTGLMVAGRITWTAGQMQVLNTKLIHIGNSTGSSSSDNAKDSPTNVFPSTGTYNNPIRISGSIDQTPSPAVFQTSPFDFATLFDTYRNNSFGLSNCASNVQLQTVSGTNIASNLVTSPQTVYINTLATGVNNLILTTSSLSNITGIEFQGAGIPSSTKILIISVNITANYSWSIPALNNVGSSLSPNMLWNFFGATSFNLTINNSNTLVGTLFAPNFNVIKTGTGNINGAVIARTLTMGAGEVTYHPFNASASNCCSNITAAGSITGNETGVCGYDPAATVNSTSASGGSGTLEYRWEQSTNNGATWTEIAGATSTTYNPGIINTTTQYRRKARRRGCSSYLFSNTITKTVTPASASISGNDNVCTGGSTNLTSSDAGSGGSYLWSTGATTATITVTPGASSTYTVTVTTSAGCVATASKTVSQVNCTGNTCFSGASSISATSNHTLSYALDPVNNSIKIRTTLSKNYVDNTYGTNIIGWPSAHTFADLLTGDYLTIALFDGGNVKRVELKLDYLTASAAAPSGYDCLGVSGGDGAVVLGSAADVIAVTTSLDQNLNTYNYVLTTNSPATDNNYTVNPTYPNWIYDVWYEVDVKLSALGAAGFGSVSVTGIGAGPSKIGTTTTTVSTVNCCDLFVPTLAGNDFFCQENLQPEEISVTGTGQTYLWSTGATTSTITVSPVNATYTVTVTNSLGCTKVLSRTMTVKPCTGQICFNNASAVSAKADWSIIYGATSADDKFKVRVTLSKNYVDNTYGTNAIGWPSGHTFNDFLTTDFLTLALYDPSNVKKMEFKMDYLSASGAAPSGYKSLGVSGGDGAMVLGSASDVLSVTTSLDVNLNTYNYVLTTNSPATDVNYTVNPTYPNWIHEVWYEAEVKLSVFGTSGFGDISITSVGVAPSKMGTSTETVSKGTCCEIVVDINGVDSICAGGSTLLTATYSKTYDVTLQATEDTYLSQASTGVNYGGCDRLYTGLSTTNRARSIIKFDLSSIPANTVVQSAKLVMTKTGGTTTSTSIAVHRVTAAWTENTAGCAGSNATPNWNQRAAATNWTTAGGDFISTAVATTTVTNNAAYEWDVSSLVNGWLAGTFTNQGLLVKNVTEGVANEKYFGSSERTTSTERPRLEITYVGLPSSPTVTWSNGTIANSITVAPSSTTNYTVVVVDPLNCSGSETRRVKVNPKPVAIVTGSSSICIDSTTTLTPSTGGTWVSSNNAVASISSSGVVTGVSAGSASFTYTNTITTCVSNPSTSVTVNPRPSASITGSNSICVGTNTTLSPTTGGTWTSSNPLVASVTNGGVVTGLSAGTVTFTFTNSTTGCKSNATGVVTVKAKPIVSILGSTAICVGATSTLSPSSGGSWASSNAALATVTAGGVVTGVAAGSVNFTFTDATTGCASDPTSTITINAKPSAVITGSSAICVGNTTTLTPASGGTWTSSDNAIATITNAGLVTGVAGGSVTFVFTNTTTGCVSDASAPVTVNNKPTVHITGTNTICAGATTSLSPSSGGTWTSSNPSIATVNNAGIVTGISGGSATFSFTQTSTGCLSNSTGTITVLSRPVVSITGPTSVCIGSSTTLSPTTGGIWTSSNASLAVVTNAGVVTGVAAGSATFTYTQASNGCTSNPTGSITINALPVVNITGGSSICVGTVSTLSPTTGGTWASSNTGTATVTNAGIVTGVAAGTVTFTFTQTSTSCASLPTSVLTVNAKPVASITGSTTICEGSTTTVTPGTGGTWFSSNGAVATITNAGLATGVAGGTANFVFQQTTTGCYSDPTALVTVLPRPAVSITGSNSLCIGSTTTLSPSTGGTWTSSNASIASVNNSGNVTGVSTGVATFTFTETATGCISNATNNVSVNSKPLTSVTGLSNICIGTTTTLSPSAGGTWTSSDNAVATVTNDGIVTGVSPGTVSFVFTLNATTCVSDPSSLVTVGAKPTINYTGPLTICEGLTTTLSPSTGGTWTSNNPGVATISSAGVVTGLSGGTATFYFTDASTGCPSNNSGSLTVNAKPIAGYTGPSAVCVGNTTNLTPVSGGTWVSSNAGVATVTSAGVVSGIAQGTATFTFTASTTGCASDATSPLTVHPKPVAAFSGPTSICEGSTTTLSPSSGGTWVSSNPAVATIANDGVVTGVSAGTATFVFTITTAGCISDPSNAVTVNAKPSVSITGSNSICEGSTTTLSPATGGTWTSSNPTVATVSNAGLVTGVSGGTANFTFTNSLNGCSSSPTNNVSIISRPVASITGASSLCVGATTTLSPTSGGSWVSSNAAVATIASNGLVTGVSAGSATFTFTSTSTGCISLPSPAVSFNVKPIVSITGNTVICQDQTTTLSPSSGGTWSSSDVSTATVSNTGLVTGINAGSASFQFTVNGTNCPSDPTFPVTINDKPDVSFTGSSIICLGSTTTLSPTSGGTWVSSNPAVATVNNSGLVTSVSAGTAFFTFTNTATGCVSDPTTNASVYTVPVALVTGVDIICEGNTTTLSPTSGGTWTSSNPAVASVSNNGLVTGLGDGVVNFTFTNSISGCQSDPSDNITINGKPDPVITGSALICIGTTTNLTPSTGGTWISTNPAVATITNAGLVTGVSHGSSTFIFTQTNTGCVSDASQAVTVNLPPTVSIVDGDSICIGTTTTLNPSLGGTWVSSNNAIATVANNGVVTGVSPGLVNFTFTNSITGCVSQATQNVTVNSRPVVSISGPDTICAGTGTNVLPSSGGTWISTQPSIAEILDDGTVISFTGGTCQFIFTETSTGCSSLPTGDIEIIGRPAVFLTGDTTICEGSSTTLSPTSGGTWQSTNPAVATVSNGGVVSALFNGSATFIFTDATTGCSSIESATVIVNAKPVPLYTGPTGICVGSGTQLSPTTGGIWVSTNPAVATINNSGAVQGLALGTANFVFTDTITGCISDNSSQLTVSLVPAASLVGSPEVCTGSTTTLSPSTGGTWVSSNPAVATVSNSGIVTGVSTGTVGFTYYANGTGCASDQISGIQVYQSPTATINYNGSVCLTTNTLLTADVSGGTGPYTFSWTGPSSFSSTSQTINVSLNGSYQVTVTDFRGCTSTNTGFVHEAYQPLIVTLQPEVCEGTQVDLTASGTGSVAYQWGASAGNATTPSVQVYPSFPSTSYIVTVTNNLGCTSTASTTITAKQKPTVSILGQDTICAGSTTTLSPSSGGSWISSNSAVATISNGGIVTGVSGGSATFTFTLTSNGCSSDASMPIEILNTPAISITGPTSICLSSTTSLLPAGGGIWSSSNSAIATVSNSGVVTGVSPGWAQFTFVSDTTSCSSKSDTVFVDNYQGATITGDNSICVAESTVLSASISGGTWASSNSAIASVTSGGLVTGASPGFATISYTRNSGACTNQSTFTILVNPIPTTIITGPSNVCVASTTTLSPVSGGTWVSSNPSVASVNNAGVVTGVQAGSATFVFTNTSTGCVSNATNPITVLSKPVVSIVGSNSICTGTTTTLSPSSGGAWSSSNTAVASVTSGGVVTGTGPGTATFTYTQASTGCSSDPTAPVTINARPAVTISFNGSRCLTDTTRLTANVSGGQSPYIYNWSGPSFSSNLQTIDADVNGNYNVTITDQNLCSNTGTTQVYESYIPVVLATQSTICEGQSVNLSVSASSAVNYQWSATASNSTLPVVTVLPAIPSTLYQVTVTNLQGCTASATKTINVNPKPIISLSGPSTICVGQVTSMLPSSGGVWTSSNSAVATISSSGFVQGASSGSAFFTFTNSTTGCVSNPSTVITVSTKPTALITGPNTLCIGGTTTLSPTSGGTWASLSPAVASVTNAGVVTALSSGTASFVFTLSGSACASDPSQPVTINPKPGISLNGTTQLCIGNTANFNPSTGGTWSSSNPAVASITNAGLVTALSVGNVQFTYTDLATGCVSDPSPVIPVNNKPVIGNPVASVLCMGETTTISSPEAGTWTTVNSNIATITNAGLITALNPGQVAFTFTSSATGCTSLPTTPILINPLPIVALNGPASICINSTTQLSPTTGGVWTSNNPTIASISNGGLITGLSQGTATFKFTSSTTGCVSLNSIPILVYLKPPVSITGPSSICIGSITTLQPASGGVWTSSNPGVASVTSGGVVTGVSLGSAKFVFVESNSGCISDSTNAVIVATKPVVSVSGPSSICIGGQTTLLPSSGGVWISNNPGVATVNAAGVVTGVSHGTATFVYEQNGGCTSDPTSNITVNGKPSISANGGPSLCPMQTAQMSPSTGGTWISSNPSIATINNSGLVTGITPGSVRFIFQSASTGCYSDSSAVFTVNGYPFVSLSGPASICPDHTTSLLPGIGGIWTSNNPAVANISTNGTVLGISQGTAGFTFTSNSTGCSSQTPINVTVLPRPVVTLPQSQICINQTLSLTPPSTGNWIAMNPSIASINAAGLVTALYQGTARFTFTSTTTGCTSLPSAPLIVNNLPITAVTGPSQLCEGMSTTLSPTSGGTWVSSNPSVAIIDNMGSVTAIAVGNASFTYTETSSGCVSDNNASIDVIPGISVSIDGPSEICIGYETQLQPSTGGTWQSTDLAIAFVTNDGKVVGVAPGKASFTYTEINTGCMASLVVDALTVKPCLDPDANITTTNTQVSGDVSTNDEEVSNFQYGAAVILKQKPSGSLYQITMNTDGTYNFSANTPGEYIFEYSVCISGRPGDCHFSILSIHVVNPYNYTGAPVGIVDIASTFMVSNIQSGVPVELPTLLNDKCVKGTGCDLDTNSVTIYTPPKYGTASIQSNGNIIYTSNPAFKGVDTIVYQVCNNNLPASCITAMQVITTNALNAINSTVGADDFIFTNKNTGVAFNVKQNDSDPEGDIQSVNVVGTPVAPVQIPQGTYYLEANGNGYFTPVAGFTGPVDIVYTICDNHSTSFCTKATVHILVLDDISVRLKVYLEGPLSDNGNALSAAGKPLMRDNLRVNPFDGKNYIPVKDPYKFSNANFDITPMYEHKAPGNFSEYEKVSDSLAVFSVTGDNAIVDWVFVELRSKDDSTFTLATRSGLLQRDGDIVDIDGYSDLAFPGVNADSFYIVVRHRSHLGVMSQKVANFQIVDFTSPNTPVFDFGTTLNNGFDYAGLSQNANVKPGFRALWGGDFNADGKLKFTNPNDDLNLLFFDVFVHPENVLGNANFNFAYGYYMGDINLNGKVKFDNPNDDKNVLYAQILFYPLNTDFLSNFNFFIEQIP